MSQEEKRMLIQSMVSDANIVKANTDDEGKPLSSAPITTVIKAQNSFFERTRNLQIEDRKAIHIQFEEEYPEQHKAIFAFRKWMQHKGINL